MSFNFDLEDLNKVGESKAFNDGIAGRVTDVTVIVEKLGVDYQSDSQYAPKYRVVFIDSEGRRMNRACFPIRKEDYPNQWGVEYEDALKKEWIFLSKIVEHSGGTVFSSFSDDMDLYQKVKSNLGTDKINIFANYGSTRSPKGYIELRKWLPAVEAGSTSKEDSKLVAGGIDQMTRPTPDEDGAESVEDNSFI